MKTLNEEEWYKEMRNEHRWNLTNGYYAEKLGCKCVNCESEEKIEYHHIVPITVGGTNRLSNIVPLCEKCHKAVHGDRHRESYRYTKSRGRHAKGNAIVWDDVMAEYMAGMIGQKEAKRILKLSKNTHLVENVTYKQYLSSHGIKRMRNNIDIIRSHNKEKPFEGDLVGYIEYTDGKVQEIRFSTQRTIRKKDAKYRKYNQDNTAKCGG